MGGLGGCANVNVVIQKIATAQLLRRKSTRSCGCLFEEWVEKFRLNVINSGDNRSYHPLYNIYDGMIDRCYKVYHHAYYRYGGRGIKVCETWRNNFWDFVEDIYETIGKRPSMEYTIDRINNDGQYEKDNVRWATRQEQIANRGNSRVPDADLGTQTGTTEVPF